MNILLLNDTGTFPHIGCQGVSDAHTRMLAARGHRVTERIFVGTLRDIDAAAAVEQVLARPDLASRLHAADAVVLNAEGTIHHGAGRQWLAVIGAAQRLGKPTVIVNGVFEASPGYDDVLRGALDVCVRDRRSEQYLRTRGVPARLVHDSILEARFDDEPAINLHGRIVVTDWHPVRNADVGQALHTLIRELPRDRRFYYPLQHGAHLTTWRASVPTLATAGVIVTGRHHGVYLAALARRPFVALPSNTWKIEGTIEASGLPIPIVHRHADLADAIAFAERNPSVFTEFADYLAGERPLSTFRALPHDAAAAAKIDVGEELRALDAQIRACNDWRRSPMYWPFGFPEELLRPEALPPNLSPETAQPAMP